MKIVYASCAMSKTRLFDLFVDLQRLPGQQVQKYHRLMLSGFAANDVEVVALTAAPITRQNWGGLLFRAAPDSEGDVEYRYLPILNIPILKNLIVLILCFARTCRILRRDDDAIVVCDVLNFSVATGALLAARMCRRTSVGIVTDLPRHLNRRQGNGFPNLLEFFMRQYACYVFLTSQMNSVVNRRGVPHVVIEGQVDAEMAEVANDLAAKSSHLVCLYAGAVDRRYGLQSLVEGFVSADWPNSELHVYGTGDYVEDLNAICARNVKVKYFGVVPNSVVVDEELKATLLVNPRPTNMEYVSFSFPSKNMEYMASGTPVLTTRLPGMPDEYLEHVYLINDESARGITQSLEETLSISRKALHERGIAAKRFVLDCKSNDAQARRVLEMVAGR